MSGGSFDYLYQCPPEQLANRLHDVQRMAECLNEKGCIEAARETERLAEHISATFEMAPSALREMWRAMEWRVSSDWGDTELALCYSDYLQSRPDRAGEDAPRSSWLMEPPAGHDG